MHPSPIQRISLISAYLQLSKCRLTALITSTTMGGLVMSPTLASVSPALFGSCVAGTALLSASACACNNIIERQFDGQMRRTQSRVLPVGRLTPNHACLFAGTTAVAGLGILCLCCNHLTSGLGFLNIALYAGVYTPMKRMHHSCTWVGAIVGAIPPLMGYAAATGRLDAAACVLGGLLFSWQFPHFNALSWNLREDYKNAGYKIMCVTNEGLCRRTTLRHSIILIFLCQLAAPLTELTTWTFSAISAPLNLGMLILGWKFYSKPDSKNARLLFRYTLAYLPLLMVFMYATKKDVDVVNKKEEQQKGGIIKINEQKNLRLAVI